MRLDRDGIAWASRRLGRRAPQRDAEGADPFHGSRAGRALDLRKSSEEAAKCLPPICAAHPCARGCLSSPQSLPAARCAVLPLRDYPCPHLRADLRYSPLAPICTRRSPSCWPRSSWHRRRLVRAAAWRMPISAVEAAYVKVCFRSEALSLVVRCIVIATGVISTAAISRGSACYIPDLAHLPVGNHRACCRAGHRCCRSLGFLQSGVIRLTA